jgi:hypothetical protein
MHKVIVILALLFLGLDDQLHFSIAVAAPWTGGEHCKYLATSQDRPSLAIDISRVAQFKLASRKKAYRSDELVSLDMAMLNTSKDPTYFQRMINESSISLRIVAPTGETTTIRPYILANNMLTLDSFRLVVSNGLHLDTLYILADCNDAEYLQYTKKVDAAVGQAPKSVPLSGGITFDRDLYLGWGDACLFFKTAGIYKIIAVFNNSDTVVASTCGAVPVYKTAVGTVESQPLEIMITR